MIRFRPAAARELTADFRRYEKDYPGRGHRFIQAIERTLASIEEAPERSPVLFDSQLRSAKVVRFPYRVVYIMVGADIEIVAVAHAKRRPSYWRRRV